MAEVTVQRFGTEAGKGHTYALRPTELKAAVEGMWEGATRLQVRERRSQDLRQDQRTQLRLAHRWHLLRWSYDPRSQDGDPRLGTRLERRIEIHQYGIPTELLSLPVARRAALVQEMREALRLHVPAEPWSAWSLGVDLDEGQRILDWTFEGDGRRETWTSLV